MTILTQKTKLVGCMCIVLSLLLLFFNWITLKESMAYDYSGYQTEVIGTLEEVESLARNWGLPVDLDGVEKMVSSLLDGKLTAVETFTICKEGSSLMNELEHCFGATSSDVEEWQPLYMFCYAYIAMFIAVIVSGIWTIFSLVKEKYNKSEAIYFICQIALLVFFFFVTRMLGEEGLEVRITLTAILAVLLALPMSIKEKLPIERLPINRFLSSNKVEMAVQKSQIAAQNFANLAKEVTTAETWVCKSCGKKNLMSNKYCPECGFQQSVGNDCLGVTDNKEKSLNRGEPAFSRKKELKYCPNCGGDLDEDAIFCEHCGTKIN